MVLNVALTSPYGHAGAHGSLKGFLRAHIGAVGPGVYDRGQAVLPELPGAEDWRMLEEADEVAAIAAAFEGPRPALGEGDLEALMAFLVMLTGATAAEGRLGVPEAVPSGLPVDR